VTVSYSDDDVEVACKHLSLKISVGTVLTANSSILFTIGT
jgi:hypothetical protein